MFIGFLAQATIASLGQVHDNIQAILKESDHPVHHPNNIVDYLPKHQLRINEMTFQGKPVAESQDKLDTHAKTIEAILFNPRNSPVNFLLTTYLVSTTYLVFITYSVSTMYRSPCDRARRRPSVTQRPLSPVSCAVQNSAFDSIFS